MSFHALRSNKYLGCYYREYKMGWGDVATTGPVVRQDADYAYAPTDFSKQAFWRWTRAYTRGHTFMFHINPLAHAYGTMHRKRWRDRGIPSYVEVRLERADTPLRFALRVRQRADTVLTTDAASALALRQGRFAWHALQAHEAVAVSSAAETYFSRPDSAISAKRERANIFHPYWQARLAAVTSEEQRGSLGRHDAD